MRRDGPSHVLLRTQVRPQRVHRSKFTHRRSEALGVARRGSETERFLKQHSCHPRSDTRRTRARVWWRRWLMLKVMKTALVTRGCSAGIGLAIARTREHAPRDRMPAPASAASENEAPQKGGGTPDRNPLGSSRGNEVRHNEVRHMVECGRSRPCRLGGCCRRRQVGGILVCRHPSYPRRPRRDTTGAVRRGRGITPPDRQASADDRH